jgi:glycosyltransferase involved in cell wall biosynthesis
MDGRQRFIIFSCGYNCEQYVESNMSSIMGQAYDNYIHIVVDDASTDNTYKKIKRWEHDKTVIYRNDVNQKWISNALQYLDEHIQSDEDIILTVDLDDYLAHRWVFSDLNQRYNNYDCWMTYSNFKYSKSGRSSTWIPTYSRKIIENKLFRESIWSFTHLRTMKAFLWKNILDRDLRDKNGNYFKCTYDMAIGFPMLEMASPDHICYINDIQYVYNDDNPNNVDKSNLKIEQKNNDLYIRSKRKYQTLVR